MRGAPSGGRTAVEAFEDRLGDTELALARDIRSDLPGAQLIAEALSPDAIDDRCERAVRLQLLRP